MIKVVFIDIDNTLLSFSEYVKKAMRDGFIMGCSGILGGSVGNPKEQCSSESPQVMKKKIFIW